MKKALGMLGVLSICTSLVACGDPCKDGHQWVNATCTEAKYCSVCEKKEGEAAGHKWVDASCTEAKHCSACGIKEGEALGHSFGEAVVTAETTCSKPGEKMSTCSTCGYEKKENIPVKAHTPGDWVVTVQATATTKGKKEQKCAVCGGTMASEEFEKSAAEIKSDYKANCAKYSYKEISRNPDNYKGKYAHFRGEIIQSMESGNSYTFRVNITKTSYGWTDTILVTYTKKDASESRLLEDDVVDLYGMLGGTQTYKTVMGNEMTIPLMYAEYIDLK